MIKVRSTYFLNKIKSKYLKEYGLNYYESDNLYQDYERFYSTKNNLDAHNNILKK